MNDRRVLVTSCNMRFADGAEALLRSARTCHPEMECVCYVPTEDVQVLSGRFAGLASVRPFPNIVRGVPEKNLANVGRLFVVVPDADVAAYVDADVVFCRPAPELWEVPPGSVNAVRDASIAVSNNMAGENRDRFVRQFPEVASHKGANMGIFALRPSEWRDLAVRFQKVLTEGQYSYDYIIDQPILNALFSSRFNWLPLEFNAHGLFDARAPRGVRLVHFTGKVKPWMPQFPRHEPAYWFWLRYGVQGAGRAHLMAIAAWIAICSPKRWAGRRFRAWLNARGH